MNKQLFNTVTEAFQPELTPEDISITFFKCIKWQVEETMDPINCPYHYFCDSTYPGNYPPFVDILIFLFTTSIYLATLTIMIMDMSRNKQAFISQSKICFLPSGPFSLPVILLAFAKGHQVNTIFPLSHTGPAILQIVYISALTFENGADKDIRYAFFKTSEISGILHASLYLDSVVLPYYTGLDALAGSTFSGECLSCVCRKDVLIVGGTLLKFRGWSKTMFLVVGVLCLRIINKLPGWETGKVKVVRYLMESLCWILITIDWFYLTKNLPSESPVLHVATFGGVFILICLRLLKWLCTQITEWHSMSRTIKKVEKI